jgi:hypothetical protein
MKSIIDIHVRMPSEAYRLLEAEAKEDHRTVNSLAVKILANWTQVRRREKLRPRAPADEEAQQGST